MLLALSTRIISNESGFVISFSIDFKACMVSSEVLKLIIIIEATFIIHFFTKIEN